MINFNKLLSNTVLMESIDGLLFHGSGMSFDEFDTSKGESATEHAHHGYGIYLVDNAETALKYIDQYAIGQNGVLYSCKISSDLNIVNWDEMIQMHTFMEMAEELEEIDSSLADEMKNYPESYQGDTFTYGELYNIMKDVDGYENPNKFFQDYDVDGFSGSNRINPDATEYCVFDSKMIRIVDKETIVR